MSEENGYSSAADLLGRNKRRFTDAEFCGLKYRIQSLFEAEKSAFEDSSKNKDGTPRADKLRQIRARMIQACTVDGNGQRVFDAKQLPELMLVDGREIGQFAEQIMAHVGWSQSDVEELVKNSPETPAEGSS